MQDQGEEAIAELEKEMDSSDARAKELVDEFSRINPPDKRYARKKVVDWLQYLKKKFQKTSTTKSDKEKPMTKAKFLKWAKNDEGLDSDEAEEYWNDLYRNPKIERDDKGFKGNTIQTTQNQNARHERSRAMQRTAIDLGQKQRER